MVKVNIKALSANRLWQGRRFKTKEYKIYEEELMYSLPPITKITDTLYIKVGFSNKMQDLDNVSKGLIDILQKRYNFNDRDLYKIILEKEIVPKGKEYIEINFV